MLAWLDRTSMLWARVVRGAASRAKLVRPAAEWAASAPRAATPAPDSTRMVWPWALSFLVVSGVAETRDSPAAVSRGTPISMFLSPRPSRDGVSLQERRRPTACPGHLGS